MIKSMKWKPQSIIKVIESVEDCKLIGCNKTRGHYMFYRKERVSDNPILSLDECYISYIYDKEKNELHGLYSYVKSGNCLKRIWKR